MNHDQISSHQNNEEIDLLLNDENSKKKGQRCMAYNQI